MYSSLTAALILAASLVAVVPRSAGQAASDEARTAWQYKVVHVSTLVNDGRDVDVSVRQLEQGLDALGADGWALAQEVNGALVFHRKK